ncbi:hypothetical protein FQN57_006580 [Myotisia sp. PD_48]|nr:hypothetical protein FQN57_006580 [Myotisia sp. PD_48]
MLQLDGSTLEGGGQLVRNGLALSALTGQRVRITNIRGRRKGKRGLKGSHVAAIQFILDVCGGTAVGNELGSNTIEFYPRGEIEYDDNKIVDQVLKQNILSLQRLRIADTTTTTAPRDAREEREYNIQLSTPGSIFLIFQAVYPYLLSASAGDIRLNITGGTNVAFSPSYDWISQVLVPNFARFGLPPLTVQLKHRGWSAAGSSTALGAVSFVITPLPIDEAKSCLGSEVDDADGQLEAGKNPTLDKSTRDIPLFPHIDLDKCEKGFITKVDVTVLAPDTPAYQFLPHPSSSSSAQGKKYAQKKPPRGKKHQQQRYSEWEWESPRLEQYSDSEGEFGNDQDEQEFPATQSTREFLEHKLIASLTKALCLGRDDQMAQNKTAGMNMWELYNQGMRRGEGSPNSPAFNPNNTTTDQEKKYEGDLGSNSGDNHDTPLDDVEANDGIVINLHTSEATQHYTQTYLLLVAHTSTGFRLGRSVLYGALSEDSSPAPKKNSKFQGNGRKQKKNGHTVLHKMNLMVDQCIAEFMEEFEPAVHTGNSSEAAKTFEKSNMRGNTERVRIVPRGPVDIFMRDQIVVFEALGMLRLRGNRGPRQEQQQHVLKEVRHAASTSITSYVDGADIGSIDSSKRNSSNDLSLHTLTAMWVCQQILGS